MRAAPARCRRRCRTSTSSSSTTTTRTPHLLEVGEDAAPTRTSSRHRLFTRPPHLFDVGDDGEDAAPTRLKVTLGNSTPRRHLLVLGEAAATTSSSSSRLEKKKKTPSTTPPPARPTTLPSRSTRTPPSTPHLFAPDHRLLTQETQPRTTDHSSHTSQRSRTRRRTYSLPNNTCALANTSTKPTSHPLTSEAARDVALLAPNLRSCHRVDERCRP